MNLHRRLAKLEGKVGPFSVKPTYDLRLLHPEEVDFIFQFMFRPPDDQDFLVNIPAIEALFRQCAVAPIPGKPTILPTFPHDLQVYWRQKRFSPEGSELPRGNYDFRNLSYSEQAEFQMLCEGYGWDPDANEVEIAPLTLWANEDLLELYELLEKAVPETEKAMRNRGGGPYIKV